MGGKWDVGSWMATTNTSKYIKYSQNNRGFLSDLGVADIIAQRPASNTGMGDIVRFERLM